MFKSLGFKTSHKWSVQKLTSKIKNLPDSIEDITIKDAKVKMRVKKILAELKAGKSIRVFDPDDAAADKKRANAVKEAKKREVSAKTEKVEKKVRKKKRVKNKAKKEAKKKERAKKRAKAKAKTEKFGKKVRKKKLSLFDKEPKL